MHGIETVSVRERTSGKQDKDQAFIGCIGGFQSIPWQPHPHASRQDYTCISKYYQPGKILRHLIFIFLSVFVFFFIFESSFILKSKEEISSSMTRITESVQTLHNQKATSVGRKSSQNWQSFSPVTSEGSELTGDSFVRHLKCKM